MLSTLPILFLLFVTALQGCFHTQTHASEMPQRRSGPPPQTLAVYEAWFGHPRHIKVDYSSHDEAVIRHQIDQAKRLGISGFVVDWYGYREPFIDRSYALMQSAAGRQDFHIAMMYDEPDQEDGATDEAIEDFKLFHKTYLANDAPGRAAYLTFEGRPVIFIFPKGRHIDWNRVRTDVNRWEHPPVLIDEYPPDAYAPAIDGYYAWVSPGQGGWAADGSHWGDSYLREFYGTMASKHPDKLAIGGAWASFDDSKAGWGLNRHISARCGQTIADTLKLWRDASAQNYSPYLLIETWNDYEEGTAIEPGGPAGCPGNTALPQLH